MKTWQRGGGVALALVGLGLGAWQMGWRPALPEAVRAAWSPPTDAVHKCADAQGRLLYTTAPCPEGTKSHAVKGHVNVLPAPQLPKPAASVPGLPGLRQLHDPAEAAELRDRRMEKIINQ